MVPLRTVFSAALVSGLLLATGAAPAATSVEVGGGSVEGSGRVVDDARPVQPFTRVVVTGAIDVRLRRTGAEKATVHADDNIAPLIDVRTEGGRLLVRARDDASFRTRSRLFVTVEFKQLDSLRLDGSSDIDVDEIKTAIFEGAVSGSGNLKIGKLEAGTVAVVLTGSGDFDARGSADKAGFVIDGSGDVHAEELRVKSAAVRIAGSGDATVCASDTLQVRIAGSGDVRYCGSPRIEKKIAGSGEVKPLR